MTRHTKIIGTGSALPERRVSNQELADEMARKGIETSDEWITTRTGIRYRHYAEAHQHASDLALIACQRAIRVSGVSKDEIDLIVLATSTPDHVGGFPSTAAVLQHKLEMANTCAAFDVQAVCSGFVYALTVADALMKTCGYRNALVVGAEVYSRIIDFDDRATCVLFGDGAGAVVLGVSDKPGMHGSCLHADGGLANILADAILSVLEQNRMSADEIDWLVLHQANIRILHAVAKQISLPIDKLITTVDRHANTSAASIPLALDAGIREGKIKPGHKVMLAAVGGGLTWGATLLGM
ncbi:3-oxoacyl-[acyl-carrier-protein] synthase-3 [Paucimonas lemoignei]|uniref:Beta-ketoacyl-[acyl-carrier-protein] synthase III n=1 Tax=Paucimonas lemoignei TaxID=29443 RepID=A0A4R3HWL4_PAULE|nr:beta-ketoacyl-ACP synthase III [Paucimonas lemoignei]TCS35779.1 3-oxoacyl-[acyl-carrier-protein] synthase-3 [Paucimonas lemoignei]